MQSWEAFARAQPDLAARGRELLYQRGDGEAFLTTVAANGTPRIHPLNVGVRDGGLLVFVQAHSAKARDLESNQHYALHAHQDADHPHEFMVRGQARLVTDPRRAPPRPPTGSHGVGGLSALRAPHRARAARRARDRIGLAAAISVLAKRRGLKLWSPQP